MLANDALELLKHLKWSENVHLVGVSMGGMISQNLVLQDPNRFASVTFISTYNASALVLPTVTDLKMFFKMTARSRNGMIRPLIKNCFPNVWLQREYSSGISNFQFLEEASKKLNEGRPENTTSGEYSQLASTLLHNVPPHELKKVSRQRFRCLVLHGTRDCIIRPIYGKLLSSLLSCPLVYFKKSGHMLMIERRDEFNAILHAHFEGKPLGSYLSNGNLISESPGEPEYPRLVFSGTNHSNFIERTRTEYSRTSESKLPALVRYRSLPVIKDPSSSNFRLNNISSPVIKMFTHKPELNSPSGAETNRLHEARVVPRNLRFQTLFTKIKSITSPTFFVPCLSTQAGP